MKRSLTLTFVLAIFMLFGMAQKAYSQNVVCGTVYQWQLFGGIIWSPFPPYFQNDFEWIPVPVQTILHLQLFIENTGEWLEVDDRWSQTDGGFCMMGPNLPAGHYRLFVTGYEPVEFWFDGMNIVIMDYHIY